MNKRDRETVEDAKKFPGIPVKKELILIIDRLDEQLTEIRETGEPFRKAAEQIGANYPDFYSITVTHPKEGMDLHVGDFRRHAKALKEE